MEPVATAASSERPLSGNAVQSAASTSGLRRTLRIIIIALSGARRVVVALVRGHIVVLRWLFRLPGVLIKAVRRLVVSKPARILALVAASIVCISLRAQRTAGANVQLSSSLSLLFGIIKVQGTLTLQLGFPKCEALTERSPAGQSEELRISCPPDLKEHIVRFLESQAVLNPPAATHPGPGCPAWQLSPQQHPTGPAASAAPSTAAACPAEAPASVPFLPLSGAATHSNGGGSGGSGVAPAEAAAAVPILEAAGVADGSVGTQGGRGGLQPAAAPLGSSPQDARSAPRCQASLPVGSDDPGSRGEDDLHSSNNLAAGVGTTGATRTPTSQTSLPEEWLPPPPTAAAAAATRTLPDGTPAAALLAALGPPAEETRPLGHAEYAALMSYAATYPVTSASVAGVVAASAAGGDGCGTAGEQAFGGGLHEGEDGAVAPGAGCAVQRSPDSVLGLSGVGLEAWREGCRDWERQYA